MLRNTYFNTFKNIYNLLRILGIFPFRFQESGGVVRKETTLSEIFFTMLFLTAQLINVVLLHDTIKTLIYKEQYHSIISFLPFLNTGMYGLLIPVLYWNKGNNLENLINGWNKYHVKFQSFTGTFINIKGKKIFQKFIWNLVGYTLIFFISTVTSEKMLAQGWSNITLFHTSFVSLAMFMGCWTANTQFLRIIADDFLSSLQTCMVKSDFRMLKILAVLWLDISALMNDIWDFTSEMIMITFSLLLVNGVISFYFLFFWFSSPRNIDVEKYLNLIDLNSIFITIILCFIIMFHVCESGYTTKKKVFFEVRDLLIDTDLRGRNPKILNELRHFFRTLEVKSTSLDIQNRDYFKLNRISFCQVLMYVVNYLIVLQQFTPILITLSLGSAREMNGNSTKAL